MIDQYQEHLSDSAACSSRFDGFDRGDVEPMPDQSQFDGDWEDIEF